MDCVIDGGTCGGKAQTERCCFECDCSDECGDDIRCCDPEQYQICRKMADEVDQPILGEG
jgi:hypothetical protein